jgi:hypothetical protein
MNYPFDFDAIKAIEIILYIANKVAQPNNDRNTFCMKSSSTFYMIKLPRNFVRFTFKKFVQ